MKHRPLGATGLRVSELAFGTSRIASLSTPYPRAEVAATIALALDRQINLFDTADVYGQGDSERLLGQVLRGRRENIIIVSKAGLTLSAPQRLVRQLKPVLHPLLRRWRRGRRAATELRERSERQCFEPGYIRGRVESSLRRLGVDCLDVFLLHNPPATVLADPALLAMLASLQQAGSIRHYGVSCRTLADAEAARRLPGVACLQVELNPLVLSEAAEATLRAARRAGIGIIGRAPLAGGAIAAAPGLQAACEATPGRTPAALALRYALALELADSVLVGMSCRTHLQENLAALAAPPLTDRELAAAAALRPDTGSPRP